MKTGNIKMVVNTSAAETLLKRGNWKTSSEGWSYWATEYNRLLVIEGKHEEVLRLDIVANP
jgi:hypothetical protein